MKLSLNTNNTWSASKRINGRLYVADMPTRNEAMVELLKLIEGVK